MAGTHRFGMFAKYWEPGQVKTRLASGIGAEKAAAVYKAFLDVQVSRFAQLNDPQIVFSPEDRQREFESLLGAQIETWQLQPQAGGDLGNRMAQFFQDSFDQGFERVTLIGSDTPTLPLGLIQHVGPLLDTHDVVLGPTEDGGYYLVAAKHGVPPIFTDIAWSTENVWHQTIEKLEQNNVPFTVLPTWYDVDDADDLQRLRIELSSTEDDERLRLFQQQINSILDSESR